jgi:hypothetical protein
MRIRPGMFLLLCAWLLTPSINPVLAAEPEGAACTLENDYVRYVLGFDGKNLHWVDKQDGKDYLAPGQEPVAQVKLAGKTQGATEAAFAEGKLTLKFGDSGVQATLRPHIRPHYLAWEVLEVQGPAVEEFVFANIPLSLEGKPEESFAGCALALNLKTKVAELPGPMQRLHAFCYPRFGLVGAKVALIGCPTAELRRVLQEVVTEAEELPKSPIGGPWALGQAINQGSYLFNFGDMSEDKVDGWIALCKRLGMNQIDFHGGSSFRFGDCLPNPKTYPNGMASFKAVIDKLHAAGISAGLHTYAFFIDKRCPWVTPIPDPRLAKDATFTLAEALPAEGDTVRVVESTANMSAITGFGVRNSVTLQIDDELITYTSASKEAPFAFTGCKRGACGTKVATHAAGAKVHHLKECFGRFAPDPDTTLLEEVAAKTAEMFNTCGFDMIYLDALDGEDVLGGAENGWHYGSAFVYEIWKRLQRPALMEMSTFHHHLWVVRSRMGAWDHPTRSHKKFIDIHCEGNASNRRMFLPGELGWWAFKTWTDAQGEPTFSDDIEYLMGKCLGTDTGLALMGIDPNTVDSIAALPRLADITRRYENLRHSGQVPESIKEKLRVPGAEFTLVGSLEEGWKFLPVKYQKHKVLAADDPSSAWRIENTFGQQPVKLRIEALLAAKAYDAPEGVPVAEFAGAEEFSIRAAQANVNAELKPSQEQVKVGGSSGCYTATNGRPTASGAWTRLEKTFDPPKDLKAQQALGLWVYGDGQQELLNVQLRSPEHLSGGIADHYIPIDFTGWRYFELIEPEGERHADYVWPYGGIYAMYREHVNFGAVASVGLWYNNLPPGKEVKCFLSPIRAVPLAPSKLINPVVTIGDQSIRFPVEMPSGSYLEYLGPGDCKLYGPKGELLAEVTPEGGPPTLAAGPNDVKFASGTPDGLRARARVTVISQGEAVQ